MSISVRLKNAVAGRLSSTGSNQVRFVAEESQASALNVYKVQGSHADTQAMVAAAEASIEKVKNNKSVRLTSVKTGEQAHSAER